MSHNSVEGGYIGGFHRGVLQGLLRGIRGVQTMTRLGFGAPSVFRFAETHEDIRVGMGPSTSASS